MSDYPSRWRLGRDDDLKSNSEGYLNGLRVEKDTLLRRLGEIDQQLESAKFLKPGQLAPKDNEGNAAGVIGTVLFVLAMAAFLAG